MTNSFSKKTIVFYADDDLDDIELLREAFNDYSKNVELVTARDGIDALAQLYRLQKDQTDPCLIILDINMPLMDVKEVLKHIQEVNLFAEVPKVLFSTSSQNTDKFFANRYGASFMTKPLESMQMARIVDQFIDHCNEGVRNTIRK